MSSKKSFSTKTALLTTAKRLSTKGIGNSILNDGKVSLYPSSDRLFQCSRKSRIL